MFSKVSWLIKKKTTQTPLAEPLFIPSQTTDLEVMRLKINGLLEIFSELC